MRVLITRAEGAARRTAAALAAAGHEVVIVSLMEIHYRTDTVDSSDVAALAVTSGEAIAAVAGDAGLRRLPVYAIGRQTGNRAKEAGFGHVKTAEGCAKSLASRIADDTDRPAGPVLYLSGEVTRGDLVGDLVARGIAARRQVVYDARPVEHLSEEGRRKLADPTLDAVMLFSPRSATVFLDCLYREGLESRLADLHVIVLSEAVAAPLRDNAANSILIAPAPELSVMIHMLDELTA